MCSQFVVAARFGDADTDTCVTEQVGYIDCVDDESVPPSSCAPSQPTSLCPWLRITRAGGLCEVSVGVKCNPSS
jgi:hypothetical protein